MLKKKKKNWDKGTERSVGSLCRGVFAPSSSMRFFFFPLSETEVNYFNNKSLIGRRARSSEAARIRKGKESCLKLPVTQNLVAQIAGETEEKRGPMAAEGEARVIGAAPELIQILIGAPSPRLEYKHRRYRTL